MFFKIKGRKKFRVLSENGTLGKAYGAETDAVTGREEYYRMIV